MQEYVDNFHYVLVWWYVASQWRVFCYNKIFQNYLCIVVLVLHLQIILCSLGDNERLIFLLEMIIQEYNLAFSFAFLFSSDHNRWKSVCSAMLSLALVLGRNALWRWMSVQSLSVHFCHFPKEMSTSVSWRWESLISSLVSSPASVTSQYKTKKNPSYLIFQGKSRKITIKSTRDD